MSESVTYEELIRMLGDNYRKIESSIVNQILLNVDNHYPTVGSYRENVWKSLFEMVVPKKYCIEQGVFIIDSYGNKSAEVDLVIFDEMYTPYIFNYGEIKFIPIEAVAAVIQGKSHSVEYKDVENWRKTIRKLFTSLDSVARMTTYMVDNKAPRTVPATQTATRPIMILCAIKPINSILKLQKDFDIILSVDETSKKLCKYIRGEEKSLEEWNNALNHALEYTESEYEEMVKEIKEEIETRKQIKKFKSGNQRQQILQSLKVMQVTDGKEEENVLLSLIFQLNQLLMILNNPMLFPHHAYAERFSTILGKPEKGETNGQQK
ncbi:hypothetical protein HGO97_023380 [Faecalicatena sp. AGMB00832]|uniref:DUF6602 domain-containing protein n=1 Tax=Faecalicatena faecalis TaxID=2726362 RepID=A0ABS6DC10_9FIRM|nr:DUF6602 domain-containing protein [Faecalicatena faecalis]MBU3878742.1 hypothetical protein [Faecalicatena faecalis]